MRFAQGGAKALVDGSRAPHSTPQRTEEALERLIVSERRLHPTWGPKKLRVVLERKHAIVGMGSGCNGLTNVSLPSLG